jgi:hypothetical protein
MRRRITVFRVPLTNIYCSTHRGRHAIAILCRSQKHGPGWVNMRFYCDECLQRKQKRNPEIPTW